MTRKISHSFSWIWSVLGLEIYFYTIFDQIKTECDKARPYTRYNEWIHFRVLTVRLLANQEQLLVTCLNYER